MLSRSRGENMKQGPAVTDTDKIVAAIFAASKKGGEGNIANARPA